MNSRPYYISTTLVNVLDQYRGDDNGLALTRSSTVTLVGTSAEPSMRMKNAKDRIINLDLCSDIPAFDCMACNFYLSYVIE